MNFNEEIKQLVKSREEQLEEEFKLIVKRCIDVIKKDKCFIRTFVFCKNHTIGVISNFLRSTEDCLISKRELPIIDDKYFYCLDDEEQCFDDFLKDFEYYLYKNTNFNFHETKSEQFTSERFTKLLCIELPM